MIRLLIPLVAVALVTPACALDLSFEVFPGAPVILSSTLEIYQDGHPDLSVDDPDYRSEPLAAPWYYALRLSTPVDGGAWAVELLHQKMMLNDPPPEVQAFTISHGYNIVTLQRHWTMHDWRLVGGAGWVVGHPENTVRGLVLDEKTGMGDLGYHLAGPALTAGVGRRHRLGDRVFLAGEARLAASWTKVPVADGEARIRDLTAHFLLGAGVDF